MYVEKIREPGDEAIPKALCMKHNVLLNLMCNCCCEFYSLQLLIYMYVPVCYKLYTYMSEQPLGGIPLGFGIVVEDKRSELSCTIFFKIL